MKNKSVRREKKYHVEREAPIFLKLFLLKANCPFFFILGSRKSFLSRSCVLKTRVGKMDWKQVKSRRGGKSYNLKQWKDMGSSKVIRGQEENLFLLQATPVPINYFTSIDK